MLLMFPGNLAGHTLWRHEQKQQQEQRGRGSYLAVTFPIDEETQFIHAHHAS